MGLQSRGDRFVEIVNYILLALIAVVVIYPLVFVLSASFSKSEFVLRGEMWLWPQGFNIDAYTKIFQNKDLWIGYKNTILYTVVGTSINLLMTIIAAYPMSRKDFKGRNIVMGMMVVTLFFSGGLIPTYLLIKKLHLLNTFWVMVIPNAVSVWNIIIMRTFFQSSIPHEIQESAMMDGCANWQILIRIVLPLSMPVIAVMILFYAVGHWNAFFNALIYLNDKDKFPLQLILREMLIQNTMKDMAKLMKEAVAKQAMSVEGIKYAIIVVANLPVLLLYPFLQKYFVKGVMIGALKG